MSFYGFGLHSRLSFWEHETRVWKRDKLRLHEVLWLESLEPYRLWKTYYNSTSLHLEMLNWSGNSKMYQGWAWSNARKAETQWFATWKLPSLIVSYERTGVFFQWNIVASQALIQLSSASLLAEALQFSRPVPLAGTVSGNRDQAWRESSWSGFQQKQ